MNYPGRLIKMGETDAATVKAIKIRLNEALATENDPKLRLDPTDPNFGPKMKQAVKLFQSRNVDSNGNPLNSDGKIGSITWAVLFGAAAVPVSEAPASGLLAELLKIAAAEEAKQVREVPKDSNRGPEVDQYLLRAGVTPGLSWCCAFVYWCFDEAANVLGQDNPMVKTAGCLDHWRRAPAKGAKQILKQLAIDNPGLVKPGMVFIMDHGGGLGHTGLVEKVTGGMLTTIEGNTDASRTREGGGVYRLTRKIGEINKGFIDYSGVV
ncbi:CHAP domain-containing protein [Geobacter pelophilus]|uniref:CHAP domain-containing protein n=1 Tax=Geoanaerobacter pelophilus TaxID=60036 RepID=A0AAW4LDQ6_9BACT|nr:CHAP domain-containing protein [Geoanaerobacter pelophilus]MBT0666022.1 CHAP domain-containing protein [Geoanaerobacter pelophilus]